MTARPLAPLRRFLACALVFVLGALGPLAGCGSPLVGLPCEPDCEGACLSDADCAATEVCAAAVCVPRQCTRNDECPDDGVCKAGQCVAAPECVTNSHCPCTKAFCVEGACEAPAVDCNGVPPEPTPCAINSDCPEKQVCVSDGCVFTSECQSNADCPAGEACYARLCYGF